MKVEIYDPDNFLECTSFEYNLNDWVNDFFEWCSKNLDQKEFSVAGYVITDEDSYIRLTEDVPSWDVDNLDSISGDVRFKHSNQFVEAEVYISEIAITLSKKDAMLFKLRWSSNAIPGVEIHYLNV